MLSESDIKKDKKFGVDDVTSFSNSVNLVRMQTIGDKNEQSDGDKNRLHTIQGHEKVNEPRMFLSDQKLTALSPKILQQD